MVSRYSSTVALSDSSVLTRILSVRSPAVNITSIVASLILNSNLMNITNQVRECHSERSEESPVSDVRILRCAQNDRADPGRKNSSERLRPELSHAGYRLAACGC